MRTTLKPYKQRKINFFPSYTFDVSVPEGKMYVHIVEDNEGNIVTIQATIGKAGSIPNAWAAGVCDLIVHLINELNVQIDLIIRIFANSRSGAFVMNGNIPVFSGLHGIGYALQRYKDQKYKEALDDGSISSRRVVRRIG